MQIKLKANSKRARDRINSYGDAFLLLERNDEGTALDMILVESLGKSWRGTKWVGWFAIGKDVEIIG